MTETGLLDSIYEQTFAYMADIERKFHERSGEEKKNMVLSYVQIVLGREFAHYKELISSFIDFTVTLSKNKRLLKDINKYKFSIKNYCL